MEVLVVLIFVFFIWIIIKISSGPSNTKDVRLLTKGKTKEQVKAIEYFCKKGCLKRVISDEEYLKLVRDKRDSMNFKQKALNKIGLDEEEVSEISPVKFEGFVYKFAYAKQNASGKWVSSSYQVSWLFFSSTQLYIYSCTFNMDDDKKNERTDEFFYKDVTSFSTFSQSDIAHDIRGNTFEITSEQFALVVPGDKLFLAMGDIKNADDIIQGMKQKLREKKM